MIEILVVMGLMTIVASVALIMNLDNYKSYLFSSDRDTIISVLQKARSQATSNVCLGTCTDGIPHGVHFQSNQYVIFQGLSFNAADPLNEVIKTNNASLTIAGINDIVFGQLSGSASPTGSLTIQDQSGHSATININSEGRIDW